MNNTSDPQDLLVRLPPLDPSTAAWLLDFCGLLQQAIWRAYGDAVEAHWRLTEPDQPIYQPRSPCSPRKR